MTDRKDSKKGEKIIKEDKSRSGLSRKSHVEKMDRPKPWPEPPRESEKPPKK